jgi:hypothetical protein
MASEQIDVMVIDEDRFMKMKPKVLGTIIFIVAAAATSWGIIKGDVRSVDKKVDAIQTQLNTKSEVIGKQFDLIQADAKATREAVVRCETQQLLINQKLDLIMSGRLDLTDRTKKP